MKIHAPIALLGAASATHAFVPSSLCSLQRNARPTAAAAAVALNMNASEQKCGPFQLRVQHAFTVAFAASAFVAASWSTPVSAEELPAGTTPFSSICMGFGCGEFQGLDYGGAPAPTDEDSITFAAFLDSLDKGLITKVDFVSNGNRAYAFVKPSGGDGEPTRIRVGEGYPDEQNKGWSSPLWVVRALKDRKIPYHFDYDLGKGKATQTVDK